MQYDHRLAGTVHHRHGTTRWASWLGTFRPLPVKILEADMSLTQRLARPQTLDQRPSFSSARISSSTSSSRHRHPLQRGVLARRRGMRAGWLARCGRGARRRDRPRLPPLQQRHRAPAPRPRARRRPRWPAPADPLDRASSAQRDPPRLVVPGTRVAPDIPGQRPQRRLIGGTGDPRVASRPSSPWRRSSGARPARGRRPQQRLTRSPRSAATLTASAVAASQTGAPRRYPR